MWRCLLFMNKIRQKKIIPEIICLISGIALSIVGLYYFHMQYLCYEYTVLQFILAVVVCLGGALLSIPLSRNAGKKKTIINAVITAFTLWVALVGLMLLINGIIGNGELNQEALIIPVSLSFIIATVLVFLCVFVLHLASFFTNLCSYFIFVMCLYMFSVCLQSG